MISSNSLSNNSIGLDRFRQFPVNSSSSTVWTFSTRNLVEGPWGIADTHISFSFFTLKNIHLLQFLSHEVALYLYKSIIKAVHWILLPYHGWYCYLLLRFARHQNVASLSPFYSYYFGNVHLNWLNWFHYLILKGGQLITLIDCMTFLSPLLHVIRMSMSTVSFLKQQGPGFPCP